MTKLCGWNGRRLTRQARDQSSRPGHGPVEAHHMDTTNPGNTMFLIHIVKVQHGLLDVLVRLIGDFRRCSW